MKKKLNIIYFVILFTVCVTQLLAQERVSNEKEISNLRKNAYEKLKSIAYRGTMKSESYKNVNDSSPYYFITSIFESVSPESTRYVYEYRTADGVKRTETITIGKKKYQRLNNEDWKEITSESGGFGGGSGTEIKAKITTNYKYLGTKSVKNQTSDLFEKVTTREYKIDGKLDKSVYTEKYWFSKDGLFLKTESEYKNNGKVTSHTIFEYEYNPKDLKIEAPIK